MKVLLPRVLHSYTAGQGRLEAAEARLGEVLALSGACKPGGICTIVVIPDNGGAPKAS